MVYLDTGCLVKLYYPEQDSALIAAKVAGEPLAYTPLHDLEISSALQLKVFRREATREQAQAALQLVAEDRAAGKLIALDMVNSSTLHAASDLANQHAAETGSRALDTLHCALAQALDAEVFISTDTRQLSLARLIGLPIADLRHLSDP